MATRVNLFLILKLFVIHFSFIHPDERPCSEDQSCVPISRCELGTDSFVFPCHTALRYVCCPSKSTNYSQNTLENRITKLFPDECGAFSENDKISGGEKADLGEFPWMALLGYKQKSIDYLQFLCGGSIITDRYILTAAHCLFLDRSLELLIVRLGELDLSTEIDCINYGGIEVCGDKYVDILVDRVMPHENYNKANYQNDIGLVKLRRSIQFTDYIKPICLPFERNYESKNFLNQNFTVSGWGKTHSGALGGSQQLLFTTVTIWDLRECNNSVPPQVQPIKANQICASGRKKEDACKGDSGGPLFNLTKDTDDQIRNFQIGIVSFSSTLTCGNPKLPTVYTRVDQYLNWIVDNVSL